MPNHVFPATGFVPAGLDDRPDQAQGLRQLFAASRMRILALAHNPNVAHAGVAMERLCAAFAQHGLHTLVVDAADSARPCDELARVDLSACVEPLSREVSYLAARGLPMRYLDARGSTAAMLGAVADAAPQADAILVHASASDLARMFSGRSPRPMLLAADQPHSLTHAYGSMKWLSNRLGVLAYDLIIAADPESPRLTRIADRLAETADRFLGAALHDWAAVDPAGEPQLPPSAALCRLAAAQLRLTEQDLAAEPPAPGARLQPGQRAH